MFSVRPSPTHLRIRLPRWPGRPPPSCWPARERTHTRLGYRTGRAAAPPAASTAGRTRRHQPHTARRAPQPELRARRYREPAATPELRGNQRPPQGPRSAAKGEPREGRGSRRAGYEQPLTHHVRPSSARHGPTRPNPPQTSPGRCRKARGGNGARSRPGNGRG